MQNSDSDDISNESSLSNDGIFQSDSSLQHAPLNANKKDSQSKHKKQIHEMRNFWYREVQPNIMGDIRAVYFLKLLGPKFSWQFFASLSYLFKDLCMPLEKVQDFHEAILDYFNKKPELAKKFPKYIKKFSAWCQREHNSKFYKGKNYDKYIQKIKSTAPKEERELPIIKKIKTESNKDAHITFQELENPQMIGLQKEIQRREMEIQTRDSFIINLLTSLLPNKTVASDPQQIKIGHYKIIIETANI